MKLYALGFGPRSRLLAQRKRSFWSRTLPRLKHLVLSHPSHQELRAENGGMGRSDEVTLRMEGLYANDLV